MTEFEKVLQDCLHDLERGASNLDECLNRHPKHALQLKPVLLTHVALEHARAVRPSPAFKARVRAKLTLEMRAHPSKPVPFNFIFMRLATSLAVIVLTLLVTGTVYAQSTLPGDAFYDWKLKSENVWRAVSPDPVGTDLAIADRRVAELIAVSQHPALYSQTLEAYLEVTTRLKSEIDTENEARILPALDAQIKELSNSGILVPPPDLEVLPPIVEPTPIVTDTPLASLTPEIPQVDPVSAASTETPLPILETLPVDPTDLPEAVPTIQDPPEIVPTIQVPQEIIPTIEIPTLLP
jgi:hypothetical protein